MTHNVLVTGGAIGLGDAISRRLSRDGAWHVIVADVNEELGRKVANDIGGSFIKVDVTDPKQVQAAIVQVVEQHGSLDGCVVNAGVAPSLVPLGDFDLDEWQRVIDINLNGAFYTLKYALAQMATQDTGGSIVSLCSTAGFRGVVGLGPYTASKFAIRGLTQMAACEYAQKKIRVNAIAPTSCQTPMVESFMAESQLPESLFTSMNALPGLVQPLDVANAAAFLLSDEARYITGHTLPVDAGCLSRLPNAPETMGAK